MTKKETAVAVVEAAEVPAAISVSVDDLVIDEGAGFEGISVDDLAIPFIQILQSGSPQIKRGEQKIESASEGDIFNTVTNAVFDGAEGIYIIPCSYRKAYVEWTPREQGGGFVRSHEDSSILDQTTKDQTGKDILDNGHVIVTTAYHYILMVNPVTGDYSEGVMAFTSTQLKKSRKWNSVMAGLKLTKKGGTRFTPPMFSHLYHVTTQPESNDLGSWSGWKIDLYSQVPTMELYSAAKKFSADVTKGLVKLAPPAPIDNEENAF